MFKWLAAAATTTVGVPLTLVLVVAADLVPASQGGRGWWSERLGLGGHPACLPDPVQDARNAARSGSWIPAEPSQSGAYGGTLLWPAWTVFRES